MAKRARGSHQRPGQRAPIQRSSTRPPAAAAAAAVPSAPPSSLTDAELARAAELEAQIVAEEKSAASAKSPARTPVAPVTRSGGTLAAAASDEYAYVARDVRRIVLIGGTLVTLLFGAWAVIQVTGVGLF